jgi:hypothetical protein
MHEHDRIIPVFFKILLQPVEIVGMGFPEFVPQGIGPDNEMPLPDIEALKQLFHSVYRLLGGIVVVEIIHTVPEATMARREPGFLKKSFFSSL